MKSMRSIFILLAVVAMLPGAAQATHWELTRGDASCEGWSAGFQLTWIVAPDRDVCADVSYVVDLVGADGTFTTTANETICESATGLTKSYSKSWSADYGLTLNGTYTATITFTLSPDYGGYDDVDVIGPFTFTCGTPNDICHYTPGYWKNHAESWPVMELSLGGRTYSQAELLTIMNTPVRGDATIILAYHTIAAKLNVANGAAPAAISGALADADAIFAAYGIGHGITGAARGQALAAKDILADYNEMECSGTTGTVEKAAAPGDEGASWGGLKSMFR